MPKRRAEYRLSPEARRDLESIWRYTFETWGLDQAQDYTDALTDTLQHLAETPGLARTCDHIREGYRQFGVSRHVIFYKEEAYGIAVIRILHNRMRAESHL